MIAWGAAVDRPRWFAIAFAMLALNGAVALAVTAIRNDGWLAAVANLFGLSAVVWVAGVAAIAILLRAPTDAPLRPTDRFALACAGMAAMIPVPAASVVALTALGLWILLTTPLRRPLARAAMIFLAIGTNLLWGRIVLELGSEPLLAGESRLVGLITGLGGAGNTVPFATGGGFFMVAPACSSLQGVSLAITCWVTVTQYFAVPIDRRALVVLAGVIAIAIAVNVARLAAIALFPGWFDFIHVGFGATLAAWIALASVLGAIWWGLRDALVARA